MWMGVWVKTCPKTTSYQIYGYGLVSVFLDISFDFGIYKFEKSSFTGHYPISYFTWNQVSL